MLKCDVEFVIIKDYFIVSPFSYWSYDLSVIVIFEIFQTGLAPSSPSAINSITNNLFCLADFILITGWKGVFLDIQP